MANADFPLVVTVQKVIIVANLVSIACPKEGTIQEDQGALLLLYGLEETASWH